MHDCTEFPDPVYKRTVLAPLFDGARNHYVNPVRAINQAHLVMLKESAIVAGHCATDIANALVDIDTTIDPAALEYTGEYEDYFFLVEAELRKRIGPDTAGMLHTARSRNDMDHTIFKWVLKCKAQSLLAKTLNLTEVLLQKARAERDTLIVAYTHGQPAQPSTYGHYLCAAAEVLQRDTERLLAAYTNIDHCPMGAAAITSSGFPINRQRMAELLGFSSPLLNTYGCIASVDYITGWYSAVKLMFLHLGRVVQDMQYWTAFEVGQLYVPNSLVQISSIMPQKRNPVPIEHLRHLASVTCGRCDTIINTMHNTPYTDMNDSEGEVQQAGYAVYDSGERVLELLATVVSASSIDSERVSQTSERACITITELADTLVRSDTLSFRQAHEIAADTAKAVIAAGKSLADGYATCMEAFEKHASGSSSLSQADYINAVSARNFVEVRDRPGGPAPAALDDALAGYRITLDRQLKTLENARQQQSDAEELLTCAFEQLLET
ncbi:argininosuccinate lyase [Chromatiales bacterium (ex Bugula neritina AB1)]|nr:argininosuccinate lyase [Chromatiales bacterium (ex Bugula neritina AB1)]